MNDTVQLSIRLKREYMIELEILSRELELPRAWFIQQAVRNYLNNITKEKAENGR